MAETSNKKTLRDVLRLVSRRWWLFLLSASLVAIAVMLGAHYYPVKYTGTTIFEHRRDVAAGGNLERGSESFEAFRLSMQKDLASWKAVVEVVEELNLLRELSRDSKHKLTRYGEMAKQQIVKNIMKDTKVIPQTRSPNIDRFSVSVTHHDPKLAQQIPNALVKNYKNRLLEDIKKRLTDRIDFLNNKKIGIIIRCESRLTEITNEKIKFETKHAGMMPESPGALYDNLQRINDRLDALNQQRMADKSKIVRLRAQLAALGNPTTPATAPTTQPARPADQATTQPAGQPVEWVQVQERNPEKKRLEKQLREFKEQLDNAIALSHMTDKHPTVRTLKAKIAELEKRLEKEPEWITVSKTVRRTDDSVARRLTAQVLLADIAVVVSELEASAKGRERLLKRRERNQVLLSNFAPVRQEYEQIIEKIRKQVAERDRWRKQLAEVQMALEAEMKGQRTHMNVLQAAEEQIRPSSPNLFKVLGFAIIGGLAVGSGLVFLASQWSHSVTTTDDARKYFDIPVFGATREITSSRQRIIRRAKRWILTPIVTIVVLAGLAASGLSITLWLKYPQEYEKWKAARISYVSHRIAKKAKEVSKLF